MAVREVRSDYDIISALAQFDPDDDELDAVIGCLERLLNHPDRDNPVPFAFYYSYPECFYEQCGRFMLIYSFDSEYVQLLAVEDAEDC